MSKTDGIKRYIAATEGLKAIEVSEKELAELRKEADLAPDAGQLVIDGVPIKAMSKRMQMLAERGMAYAGIRWGVLMTYTDVESLFKAVPDGELEALIPLILDQHMDDLGYVDPLDDMDFGEAEDMKKRLKEAGFVDVAL